MIHVHRPKILIACTAVFLLLLQRLSAESPLPVSVSRRLTTYDDDPLAADPFLEFENPRLKNAYIALQSWKKTILSDPEGFTVDWTGPDPCNYTGVFCSPAPDNECERTVAGIDINHADIAGHLPHELGLLYDLAFFHINTNRFCGPLPHSLNNMRLLHELDLSNNRFAGKFPDLLLGFPNLKYLDIRFNEFEGQLPNGLFEKDFDAIFVNDNRFVSEFPESIGKSSVSVIVMANNKFRGCLPASLGNMSENLRELIVTNNGLESCFPSEIGKLRNLTVLDMSKNKIVGSFPESIKDMISLEQLDVGSNLMSGRVPDGLCKLRNLESFVYNDNFFTEESSACLDFRGFEDKLNCIRERPDQKADMECRRFLSRGINCSSIECGGSFKPSPQPAPRPALPPPPRPALQPPPMVPCVKTPSQP